MQGDFYIGNRRVQPLINSVSDENGGVQIEPKVMQVLVKLASDAGEVVTKEAINAEVWPGVFVGEDVLIRAISEIRRVFNDDPRSPSTIQTVRKVGYRLIAPVSLPTPEIKEVPQSVSGEPVSTEVELPLQPERTRNAGLNRWVLSVVTTIVLLTVFGTVFYMVAHLGAVQDFTSHPLTTYPGQELHPAFSPDGQSVAFVWRKPGETAQHIYIKAITSEAPVRLLSGPFAEYSPAWSPDGLNIAFVRQGVEGAYVETVPATGGAERQLYTLPTKEVWEYGGITWTSDGQNLIFPRKLSPAGPSELVELALTSHAVTTVTHPDSGWDGDWMPHVSPNGKLLSFTRGSERSARDLFVMDLPNGSPRRLTSDDRLIVGTSWTSNGSAIVFASNRGGSMALWRIPAVGGPPEREPFGVDNAYSPTVSLRGNRLAYAHGNAEWTIEEDTIGGAPRRSVELLSSSEQDSAPALSPDGNTLAFQSWRSGGQEIWTSAADGKNPIQLTNTGEFSGSPAWSPTGDRIAYDARLAGFARLRVMGAHGEAAYTLPGGSYDDIVPSWSSNGQALYFGSNRSGSWQIWRMAANGAGAAEQITSDGGMVAKESPDGKWVYLTKRGVDGLWRRAASGAGNETKVSDSPPNGFQDYWAIGNQAIFLIEQQGDKLILSELNPETLKTQPVLSLEHHATPFAGLAVTRDGQHLIHADLTRAESNITLIENFH